MLEEFVNVTLLPKSVLLVRGSGDFGPCYLYPGRLEVGNLDCGDLEPQHIKTGYCVEGSE